MIMTHEKTAKRKPKKADTIIKQRKALGERNRCEYKLIQVKEIALP